MTIEQLKDNLIKELNETKEFKDFHIISVKFDFEKNLFIIRCSDTHYVFDFAV